MNCTLAYSNAVSFNSHFISNPASSTQKLSEKKCFPSLFLGSSVFSEKVVRVNRFSNSRITHVRSALDTELRTDSSQLPYLMTEFMVDMRCEGCVKNVKSKLEPLEGVKNIDIDLSNKIVRVLSNLPIKNLDETLSSTGLNSRLIGQGTPAEMELTAAVAEFKGPEIFGVVRFAHVSMNLVRIEANFNGLDSKKFKLAVHQYGDLTQGPHSTGDMYNKSHSSNAPAEVNAGDLGDLAVDDSGNAGSTSTSEHLRIWDLIGRAMVVYDEEGRKLAGAVIARSASVGENYKQVCLCDGTVIWESTNSDYVQQQA